MSRLASRSTFWTFRSLGLRNGYQLSGREGIRPERPPAAPSSLLYSVVRSFLFSLVRSMSQRRTRGRATGDPTANDTMYLFDLRPACQRLSLESSTAGRPSVCLPSCRLTRTRRSGLEKRAISRFGILFRTNATLEGHPPHRFPLQQRSASSRRTEAVPTAGKLLSL